FKHLLPKRFDYKSLLLNTMQLFTSNIFDQVWKYRCKCFKIWKDSYGITKQSFTRRNNKQRPRKNYSKHRQYMPRPNLTDLLDYTDPPLSNSITPHFDWIRWTSSNFRHNMTFFKAIIDSPCI